nr:restriction endonuclease subunit S [uncultured Halomonas sp.]
MFEHALLGWSRVNLIELATYINGYAFKPDDWSEHGLPIIRIAQITGSSVDCDYYQGRLSEDFKINNGDIVFSWSGTLCVVQWSGGPAWLNQHLFKVKPAEDISHRLLYHVLSHAVAEMNKSAHGSTMKHIKRSELKRYETLFPNSRKEQDKIGKVLDTLDTQIQQTEALIAKLEKVKEGLLHDLLTRGIDENGQLRPSPEQAPELYKESPLGLIPRGWEAVRLEEMAENHDGKRVPLKKSERKHGIYPYYGASGVIDWVERYLFEGSYVLLGEDGENVVSRNLPLAFPVSGKFWVNNHAHIYRAKDDCDPRFLVVVLEQKDYSRWVNGSAQPKITQASLRMMWFCKPSLDEQAAISNSLEAINQQIENEKADAAKKAAQKFGLMNDLLTGRVRVNSLLEKSQETTSA